jgi:hypothetical protein
MIDHGIWDWVHYFQTNSCPRLDSREHLQETLILGVIKINNFHSVLPSKQGLWAVVSLRTSWRILRIDHVNPGIMPWFVHEGALFS